ncbi:MAG TPA: ORF6N domain-containing protein [Bacteroidales bacterium]|nr:MAG: ORF6N domain protein [Bacteroidetes bacterium ADurb.Bin217]HPM12266.1 ORF6N domain-containing protein [Bacteroidales bacterium]
MSTSILPTERIAQKILLLRNEKVILDIHLAELFEIETRVLKQAVRRNIDRFPDDFMFILNDNEIDYMVSQNVIPSKQVLGGAMPFAFTETGVAMLSSVLKSKKAIDINIAIMRTFVMLRRVFEDNRELFNRLENVDKKLMEYDENIMLIFEYIKQFEAIKQQELEQKNRPRIGYKISTEQKED